MTEPEGVFARERGAVGPDQLLAHETQKAVPDTGAALSRSQRLDRPEVEDVTLDGGALDCLALLVTELIEP